jgi:hypothetical protein
LYERRQPADRVTGLVAGLVVAQGDERDDADGEDQSGQRDEQAVAADFG